MKKNFLLIVLPLIASTIICSCKSNTVTTIDTPDIGFTLDPLFTDSMVLQRDRVIKIRGWGKAKTNITVLLNGKSTNAITNIKGEWIATLPKMKAGGPYSLTIKTGNITKTLKDILIGDVWICSGQSNMSWTVSSSVNRTTEINNANYPKIRVFTVNRHTSLIPEKKLITSSAWKVCSPETIPGFSAVAYFFGRELHKKLDIPIGLINTSWGGTVAEAWTSLEMLQTLPSFEKRIENAPRRDEKSIAEQKKKAVELKKIMAIRNKEIKKIHKIEADTKYAEKISSTKLDDSKWKTMKVPTIWEIAGLKDYDGLVVFRKTINIPKLWAGKELKLALSPIDEVDVTYFNGVKVGGKGSVKKKIVEFWNQPRLYSVPGNLVKSGGNTITILVYDLNGAGGLAGGTSEDMKAYLSSAPNKSISLAGEWKYKPEFQVKSVPPGLKIRSQNNPAFLFNAMINPLLDFPITGAIWYQGESNASRAYQYQRLFPAMIQDWRIRWQQGDFPFYFVQLANYQNRVNQPSESRWAELREAQTMALRLPNTGMAVIIDIGEAKDIHPKNKQDVGKRLAQNALSKHYSRNIVPAGPLYKDIEFKSGKAILSFNNIGKGLMIKGKILKGFAISGKDNNFVWATADIKDNKVIVWNDKIKKPVAVRYAWATNPECNLYNIEGFPASPFRTDNFKMMTINKK